LGISGTFVNTQKIKHANKKKPDIKPGFSDGFKILKFKGFHEFGCKITFVEIFICH
jgi:hypothetical protein